MNSESATSFWLVASLYDQAPSRGDFEKLTESLALSLAENNDSVLKSLYDAITKALSTEDSFRDVQKDYVRLIAGLREGYGVTPPYESVYRDKANPGRTMIDLASIYSAWGVLEQLRSMGADDFIGTELRYIGLMLYSNENDQKQQAIGEFFDDHLKQWLPAYLSNAQEGAQTDYYRLVLTLTQQLYNSLENAIQRPLKQASIESNSTG